MNHNTTELRAIADLIDAIAERFHDDYNWHCISGILISDQIILFFSVPGAVCVPVGSVHIALVRVWPVGPPRATAALAQTLRILTYEPQHH